ncbi:WxcM-like domain-containing protein [Paraburkholderia phymatum]|uniref:WxcM-like domain-containing protein n=1 Tax=Paraburkholderia phymatum TaxID=148447 RepID=A0ACC6TV38_9BURK
MADSTFIHETADVKSSAIGAGSRIWQYVVVLPNAKIGRDVNLCSHCLVENDVVIGDRVTVKSGVYLWDGIHVADDVFIGPNVTFTNDKFPRSKVYPERFAQTRIEKGASIGGGAVLLPGITIGMGAMVGAGAVVTKSVPPFAIVMGSPARITGYVDNNESVAPATSHAASALSIVEGPVTRVGVGDATLHKFKRFSDPRGELSVGEFARDVPFLPKRYFLVFNVPGEAKRGEHAHLKCHQFLICVKGGCTAVVDDGVLRREITLNSPDVGLHLPPLTWGTQYKYSSDAVLLVFTSDYYDASDYVASYAEFVDIVNSRTQH